MSVREKCLRVVYAISYQDEPEALMSDSRLVLWSPLKQDPDSQRSKSEFNPLVLRRSDIAWNFEKFLVGADGRPVKRFSSNFPTSKIEADIRALLQLQQNSLSNSGNCYIKWFWELTLPLNMKSCEGGPCKRAVNDVSLVKTLLFGDSRMILLLNADPINIYKLP